MVCNTTSGIHMFAHNNQSSMLMACTSSVHMVTLSLHCIVGGYRPTHSVRRSFGMLTTPELREWDAWVEEFKPPCLPHATLRYTRCAPYALIFTNPTTLHNVNISGPLGAAEQQQHLPYFIHAPPQLEFTCSLASTNFTAVRSRRWQ